jgi:foldase protein PrsA
MYKIRGENTMEVAKMNNSKKAIKNPKNESKIKKEVKSPTFWIVTSVILVVILLGGVAFDQLYKRVILTISGDKYNMDDLSYYFYEVESQYDYFDQLFYNGTYWDQTNESTGQSNREAAKQEAVSESIYNEVLYKDAVANGYTLTDDEKKTAEKNADTFLTNDSNKAVVKKNHFTKKYLSDIMGKITLASRYRKDIIAKLNIDEDAVKATVNYDDYRRYEFEYLYISTKKTDADGKETDMTDTEKAAALDKIKAYNETAKTSTDWSKLLPDTEKDVQYVKNNFNSKSTNFEEDFRTKVAAMENNAVSDVFESNGAYYLVRMIDNNSSADYDTAVSNAITDAQNKAFTPKYQEIEKKYSIKLNDKELEKLKMGEVTIH